MTKRHNAVWEDPFDSIEEVDGFEGFIVDDEVDETDFVCFNEVADTTFCDFGFGDDSGLCIKALYGCHLEGCQYADN